MISVTAATGKYILQPSLVTMHQESLNWISATVLWKRELSFFQKLLDQHAPKQKNVEFKKQIDHYQHIITYYQGELVDELRKKLRNHEHRLAAMLQELNEADVEYFKEHQAIIESVSSFSKAFAEFKHEFFEFIERGFSAY
jgi:molybdopterin-guanine dinucleotide biosynthesis protein A